MRYDAVGSILKQPIATWRLRAHWTFPLPVVHRPCTKQASLNLTHAMMPWCHCLSLHFVTWRILQTPKALRWLQMLLVFLRGCQDSFTIHMLGVESSLLTNFFEPFHIQELFCLLSLDWSEIVHIFHVLTIFSHEIWGGSCFNSSWKPIFTPVFAKTRPKSWSFARHPDGDRNRLDLYASGRSFMLHLMNTYQNNIFFNVSLMYQ